MLAESTVSLYENDKRSPDYATLNKLAEYLETSTDYLLGRTDDSRPLSDKEGFANEPSPEEGSFEWFRRELVSHGVVKEGEDLSNDQLAFALEILPALLNAFKKKME
jgi:transcriptional regulator with XRE-family HTH domain